MNFQLFKLVLKKGRWMRYQIANIHWIIEKGEFLKKHLLWVYWLCQSIWLCESQQTVENSSRDGNTRPPNPPLEKPVCMSEATVRTRHGTMDWFKIGKGVHQGYSLSPAYLTYMQSTSCEMPSWMKYKLESRLPGEISINSDMQMTPPLWQKIKNNSRASWWKWKRRVKKLA